MRKLRPILAHVLIATFIGTLVTLGVAVAGAIMLGRSAQRAAGPTLASGRPVSWRDPESGWVYLWWDQARAGAGRIGTLSSRGFALEGAKDRWGLSKTRPLPRDAMPTFSKRNRRQVLIAGFPCDCLWGAMDWEEEERFALCDKPPQPLLPPIAVSAWRIWGRLDTSDPRGIGGCVPTAAIWSGLAINTLYYGTIVWTALFLPGILRRWRRVRAGRCLKCGYDRAGLAVGAACPECGGGASR